MSIREETIVYATIKAISDESLVRQRVEWNTPADGGEFSMRIFTAGVRATLAKARELDTCNTCKHRNVEFEMCEHPDQCFNISNLDGVGCNRHQPKDES